MTAFLIENMAPIMFVSLVVFLLAGYPVAFSLSAVGLFYALVGIELGLFAENFLQALPERVYGTMNNETLLAIPFFTLMGLILERSGMAEDLLDTIGQLFGPVRGGLAYAVIFVGALLAATTGVVAASVISMGLISLPIMLRYGYDQRLATGVITASGTLAQIIPPSIVLIVMADQLGRSVGDMYKGALIPGLLLTLVYAAYAFAVSMIRPSNTPALPPEARKLKEDNGSAGLISLAVIIGAIIGGVVLARAALLALYPGMAEGDADIYGAALAVIAGYLVALGNRHFKLGLLSRMAEAVVIVLVPPLALVFLVLGTIFLGVATPTEGGAMGAAGALILAFAKRRLTLDLLTQAVDSTAKLSAFVIFILIGARVFSLTFYGVNGHVWVEELLVSLPGGVYGFLFFVNLMVFFLGFFIDFFEIAFIVIPLLVPAAEALEIDLIWFGVILAMNLQTSFLTPPFGFALFYIRSVTPTKAYKDKVTGRTIAGVPTMQIYRSAIAFVILQLIMLVVVIAVPDLVMHYRGTGPAIDPANIQIDMPSFGDDGLGAPSFDLGPPPVPGQ